MRGRKIKFGVSLDQKIVEKINGMVEGSSDLRATRSEMVEAILTAYFRSQIKHSGKGRCRLVVCSCLHESSESDQYECYPC